MFELTDTFTFVRKTAFFWGTASVFTIIWAYFRLPETKDRTFEELDILFEKRVSARHFGKTVLEPDAVHEVHPVVEK